MKYTFRGIDRVLEFSKALLVEGKHTVSIKTVFKEFPRNNDIDYFEIEVSEENSEK